MVSGGPSLSPLHGPSPPHAAGLLPSAHQGGRGGWWPQRLWSLLTGPFGRRQPGEAQLPVHYSNRASTDSLLIAPPGGDGGALPADEGQLGMAPSSSYLMAAALSVAGGDAPLGGEGDGGTSQGNGYSIYSIFVPPDIEEWSTFVASLPDAAFPRYKMILPKKTKILALDLDETLVHSTSKSSGDCDFFIEVLIDRSSCLYYLFKRPFLDSFLDTVASWYHLVIYTASLREYADPVINWLDRGKDLFKKRLFRTACVEHRGAYVKNLLLVDSDLSRVCLLDNSPASFLMHPDSGIPIASWTHDRSDTALLDLLPFLDALRFTDDVRSILSLRRLATPP